MLTYKFLKYELEELWWREPDGMIEYSLNVVHSVLSVVIGIVPLIIDILLSPLEIIGMIIWCIRNKKKRVRRSRTR